MELHSFAQQAKTWRVVVEFDYACIVDLQVGGNPYRYRENADHTSTVDLGKVGHRLSAGKILDQPCRLKRRTRGRMALFDVWYLRRAGVRRSNFVPSRGGIS